MSSSTVLRGQKTLSLTRITPPTIRISSAANSLQGAAMDSIIHSFTQTEIRNEGQIHGDILGGKKDELRIS